MPAFLTRRNRRATLGTVLVAALLPALAACGFGGASASSGAAAPAALTWASSYFPTHWDPVVAGSGAQFRELALVYASLTRIDENSVPLST